MALAPIAVGDPMSARHPAELAVSWGAVWAGAVTSVAVSILLTLLAAGFGFTFAFPGVASAGSLAAFTPVVGAGMVAGQVIAGGLGGYVAGRLRGAWIGVHLDEAHFRDTAHGLVAWAVSTVAGLLLAALVLVPYSEHMAIARALDSAPLTAAAAERAANVAAQVSFFMAVGLLLSAFVAAVAARVGGMRSEAMSGKV